jgi:hypothetical protein
MRWGMIAILGALVALTVGTSAHAHGGPPVLELGADPKQAPKRIKISLLCPEDNCRVAVTGKLGGGAKGRTINLYELRSGVQVNRRLRLTRKQRRSVRQAGNQGKRPVLKVTATAIVPNGETPGSTVEKLAITLR